MPVADFAQGVKTPTFAMVHHTSDGLRAKSPSVTVADAKSADASKTATSDSGESFWKDVLDVVNPLQHLPVVGTVYRAVTGDKIGDVEKVAGDTLYGGPIGLVSSLANIAFEKITGKDPGEMVMGWLGIGDDDTALASSTTPAKTAAPVAPQKLVAAKTANVSPRVQATQKPAALTAMSRSMFPPEPPKQKKQIQPVAPSTPVAAAQTQPTIAAPASTPVDISASTDALLSALARNGVTGDMQTQALDAYRRTMSLNANTPGAALVN